MSVPETWRPIPGFPGYEASDEGRIRSLRNGSCILKPSSSRGYMSVNPCVEGKARTTVVHRLIALAFIGPRPNGLTINHIDGNKNNNCPSNLEYITAKENTNHARSIGLWKAFGSNSPNVKNTEEQIRNAHSLVLSGMSQREASERSGVSRYLIAKVVRGRCWAHLNLPHIARHNRKRKT